MLECIILVGLPGAGKTTFYRRYFAATHVHISKDLWPNATGRDARQRRLIDESLASGRSVIIDNTNATVADRAAILSIARTHRADVRCYFIDVTTRAAVARNAGRADKEKVPNVAIFTVAKRLQRPTAEEGFDQLFCVQITESRDFHVVEL